MPIEKGTNKLQLLQSNTYRKQFIEGLGKRRVHFKISSAMANLPVARITRPSITSDFEAFADVVEKDMGKTSKN